MSVPPIYITTMLACYVSPDPEGIVGERQWASRPCDDAKQWLLENELIDINNRATERGQAWVRFICETPLPEQFWRLPDRERVGED